LGDIATPIFEHSGLCWTCFGIAVPSAKEQGPATAMGYGYGVITKTSKRSKIIKNQKPKTDEECRHVALASCFVLAPFLLSQLSNNINLARKR